MLTPIEIKANELRSSNFSLGNAKSNEVATSFGGRMQEFDGANIYYHSVMGIAAHEVHGAIKSKYLSLGGFDKNSQSGKRVLGFPVSDEHGSKDERCRVSEFEWGNIYWIFGGVAIYGEIYKEYIKSGAEGGVYGYPLADPIKISDGIIVFFEFGCMYFGNRSNQFVIGIKHFLPQLGHPWMISQNDITDNSVITLNDSVANSMNVNKAAGLLEEIYTNRFSLNIPSSDLEIPLLFDKSGVKKISYGLQNPITNTLIAYKANFKIESASELKNRALYNININLPNNHTYVIAPHSVYFKKDWKEFKFIHATDLHISRRLDTWRDFFRKRNMDEAVKNFNNFNDNLRELIKYANKLHKMGELDFIMITGDLVDYIFEDGGDTYNHNNFVYFEQIVLGLTDKPDQVENEELRVPILTSLGNHDYRRKPYYPIFTVDITGWFDYVQEQYSSFNLTKDEAVTLTESIIPGRKISSDRALEIIKPDRENKGGTLNHYFKHICRDTSYIVLLANHQIIMIDGKWDDGPIESTWDAISYKLGFKGEATANFASGQPDSVGFVDSELDMIKEALKKDGLIIIGVHYPLINPKNSDYSYFLRSSLRVKNSSDFTTEMRKYLFRASPTSFAEDNWLSVLSQHHEYEMDLSKDVLLSWSRKKTSHFNAGNGSELLDNGVMRGNNEKFLKLCAGVTSGSRSVDLILSGHVHKNWECRIKWNKIDDRFHIFHDFFTENPSEYYHSYDNKITADESFKTRFTPTYLHDHQYKPFNINVIVSEVAENNEKPIKDASGKWSIKTKPYFPTFNSLKEAGRKLTLAAFRPFLIQTAAVGPSEYQRSPEKQPDFRGCRLIKIQSDTIKSITYVTNTEVKSALSSDPIRTRLDNLSQH